MTPKYKAGDVVIYEPTGNWVYEIIRIEGDRYYYKILVAPIGGLYLNIEDSTRIEFMEHQTRKLTKLERALR